MCKNIGGSQKRTKEGAKIGVTKNDEPHLSPGGRCLIGKLGIGLFSVSQMAQRFNILTKVKGEKTRTMAEVILFRNIENRSGEEENETTGEVTITKIAADDKASHGTDIIIDELLPRTREDFQSHSLWELALAPKDDGEANKVACPVFHIGYSAGKSAEYRLDENLPWNKASSPSERFRQMVNHMQGRGQGKDADRRPSLETTFDNYLRMVWLVALSVPLDYVDKHPFDVTKEDGLRVFQLGPMRDGRAEEISLAVGETLRERLGLKAPERGKASSFTVTIDDLELRRPVVFTNLPKTSNKITTPLLFVGSNHADTSKYKDRISGGPLDFEGYLLWVPRIVPVEHNGVLIRIGDASGSLFDETFMRYQISEQTRKEQVTSEIFVNRGMDAALHIDRESFNHSHPHYQYLASWLHDAFKQFATRHKAIGVEVRSAARQTDRAQATEHIDDIVRKSVASLTNGEEEPVVVKFAEPDQSGDDPQARNERSEALLLRPSTIFPKTAVKGTGTTSAQDSGLRKKIEAIAQILYAAGLFDRIKPEKRDRLLRDIAAVIEFWGAE